MALQVGIADHQAILITFFGVLGNVVSSLVFLSPMPTFFTIYKAKSADDFSPLPYIVSAFSCCLWLYYAVVKTNQPFLLSINSAGLGMEILYLGLFLAYCSRARKIRTAKLVLLLNLVVFAAIVVTVQLVPKKSRLTVLGYVCDIATVGVFAAPLSVVVSVIRTRDVTSMTFPLSVSLTLCSVIWFAYGLVCHDIFIMIPNIAGFLLGTVQMVVFVLFKTCLGAKELPVRQETVIEEDLESTGGS